MERSKRTPTELDLKKMGERLDQLERDIATVARAMWPHVHPKMGSPRSPAVTPQANVKLAPHHAPSSARRWRDG